MESVIILIDYENLEKIFVCKEWRFINPYQSYNVYKNKEDVTKGPIAEIIGSLADVVVDKKGNISFYWYGAGRSGVEVWPHSYFRNVFCSDWFSFRIEKDNISYLDSCGIEYEVL